MWAISDADEIYEEELKQLIEEAEKDPFRVSDLESDRDNSQVGRILKEVSGKNPDLEMLGGWPYIYTLEGNSLEDYQSGEDEKILGRMAQVLSSEGQMTEGELRSVVNYFIDPQYKLDSAALKKKGEILDKFRGRDGVAYGREEWTFEWG